MLGRHAAAVVLHDVAPFGDAQQRVVRLVVVRRGEVGLVRGDDRQPERVGELEELRLHVVLGLEAVALDLNVEPVAERRLEPFQARLGQIVLALAQGPVDGAVGAARQHDEAVGMRLERRRRRVRRLHVGGLQVRAAHELHQVGVARLAHGEQCQRSVARLALRRRRPLAGGRAFAPRNQC